MVMVGAYETLFPTLHLPMPLEAYRKCVFEQLYSKMEPVIFQSICWASNEHSSAPEQQSKIVVFPGEERFLHEAFGIHFNSIESTAIRCPHHREEIATRGEGEALTTITRHYCRLSPFERPLICRIQPFHIERRGDRSSSVSCSRGIYQSIARRTSTSGIDQIAHNIAQMAVAVWPFLSEIWWNYYNNSFPSRPIESRITLVNFDFELTEDAIVTNIRGSEGIWKRKLLISIASPDCIHCEGTGIEFWDHHLNEPDRKVPVPQRKMDLCRYCILPNIGARVGSQLVDPSSGRLLDASGGNYNGE